MQTDKSGLLVWEQAPSSLSLEPSELHLWRIGLRQAEWIRDSCRQVLDADEAERAARFHFLADRDRFLIAHGAIRHILAAYLNIAPKAVRFTYGRQGKPELASEDLDLRFNLSHSSDLAIAAFVRGTCVGVDIEWVRTNVSCMEIAERYFSAEEIARLENVPTDQQREAFFDIWTRKEAYVKACGGGLSVPLNSFAMPFGSVEQPVPFQTTGAKSDEITSGTMYVLAPLPGYKAAAIVESQQAFRVRYWEWML
jgi:4'-phosphopantetheinyl transferase